MVFFFNSALISWLNLPLFIGLWVKIRHLNKSSCLNWWLVAEQSVCRDSNRSSQPLQLNLNDDIESATTKVHSQDCCKWKSRSQSNKKTYICWPASSFNCKIFFSNLPLKIIALCVFDHLSTACSWTSILHCQFSVFTFLRSMTRWEFNKECAKRVFQV